MKKDLKVREKLKQRREIMEKLLNLENVNSNLVKTNLRLALKFRRDVFKTAASAPDYLYNFCIRFQKNDKRLLKEFKLNINNNQELKYFLSVNEVLWLHRILDTRVEYKDIFDFFFGKDRIYEKNAFYIVNSSGYFCLEFLYIVINYIDDNFPIIIKRELKEEEKRLIKFLLFKGDELDYLIKYKISRDILNDLIKNICDVYKCTNINSALNLVLIEKYFRNKNTEFINTLIQRK